MIKEDEYSIKKYNGKQGKKRGFTLVELIVTVALVTLILAMIYSFFGTSNNFFGKSDRRANAQAQLRTIMAGLKKEVSTAEYVEIAGDSRVPNNAQEELYYAGITATNDYTLLHEVIGDTKVAFSNLPLKELHITYDCDLTKPRILKVTMTTSEGYSLSAEILSPNINITGSTGTKLVLRQVH